MNEQHYYECRENSEGWYWIVYHYDSSGNREITVAKQHGYFSETEAADAVSLWLDEHQEIDAQMG